MNASDPNPPFLPFAVDHHVAVCAEGKVILADLESFRQVGVVVVLPVELRLLHRAAERFRDPFGVNDCHFVDDRQTDGTRVGVWL